VTKAAYSGQVIEVDGCYTLDDLRFEDMLVEFLGLRVKITIEELSADQLGGYTDVGNSSSHVVIRPLPSK
jgi:hypothetical protein